MRHRGEDTVREEVEAELQAQRSGLEGSKAGREEGPANLEVVVAVCREAEATAWELQEYRRVLAHGVKKASRAKQQRLCAALACATRATTAAATAAIALPLETPLAPLLGTAVDRRSP